MLVSLCALTAVAAMSGSGHFGTPEQDARPIATRAPYPSGMADDVRRPGFNGRLWVNRPVIGAIQQGPYAIDSGTPGADAYGAYGDMDSTVYARVGHLVVGIDPWQSIPQSGYRRYENARNFWLQEQGYTGGVRTFVNDLHVWTPDVAAPDEVQTAATPQPRATIKLPADMPRQHRRLRVDAGSSAPAVACPGSGPARISWPAAAPAEAVARTTASGGEIFTAPAPSVMTAAK